MTYKQGAHCERSELPACTQLFSVQLHTQQKVYRHDIRSYCIVLTVHDYALRWQIIGKGRPTNLSAHLPARPLITTQEKFVISYIIVNVSLGVRVQNLIIVAIYRHGCQYQAFLLVSSLRAIISTCVIRSYHYSVCPHIAGLWSHLQW